VETAPLLKRLQELIDALEYCRIENHYEIMMLMITNVLKEGTELVFAGDPEIIRSAFGVDKIRHHHVFLPHVLSRKKQIVPALSQIWG
jgi:manganese-dependent inorganic pyrophosphatase